ncbi:cation:proton antiporter [Actinocrispum sp. NPDC049592]|uniref:cation:proton antiporter n=1 Tax=Actinocrispum sp. NPDC049592 TaxID=3154835 RepID=UPI0034343606
MSDVTVVAAAAGPAMSDHRLLVFLGQLAGLLILALLLGHLARKLRLPAIVGELLVGVVLGPSVLGHLPADVSGWLPQRDPGQQVLLEVVGQVGLLLMVGMIGAHMDMALVRKRGSAAMRISIVGVVLPLGLGIATGYVLPGSLISHDRTTFALFMGVAMCVCAIPVIAKILMEMNLQHRTVGQLIMTAAVVDDTVGWLLLAVVTAMATAGLAAGAITISLAWLAVIILASLTIGRLVVRGVMRGAMRTQEPGVIVGAAIVLILVFSAATHAAKFEPVLGAFVCGILITSAGVPHRALQGLRTVMVSVFAPVFFAMAGLRMDLTLLADPSVLLAGIAVLVVAIGSKFAGAYLGARLSRFNHWEAFALGAGLNARGVIEVIVATVGVKLGVLNTASYTIVVLVAIVTSVMTPPLLRIAMSRVQQTAEEEMRLEVQNGVAEPTPVRTAERPAPTV